MQRTLLLALMLYLLPMSVSAAGTVLPVPATFKAVESLVAATSSQGNVYAVGPSIILTAPVVGDFSAFGGSVITAAPVKGDDLILAGSVSSRAKVAGDVRLIGGTIDINEPIGGDLIALGFSIRDSGQAQGSTFIIALNTTLSNGASGPVTIYGNNIALAGEFAGDVTLFAGSHISLAPNTRIHGSLSYEAPDIASIPSSVITEGGRVYTNASYLPNIGTSRLLAFVSIGFFLVARIIGELILAGLLAGLFPKFAEIIIERVSRMRRREVLLALLLGFAVGVVTPVMIAMLLLTFVGIGLALLLLFLYALLFMLSLLYAGILIGGMLVRRFIQRERVLWHDGVLGMLALSLVTLIPYIGFPLILLVTLFSAGTLLQIFFRFAFSHDADTTELL